MENQNNDIQNRTRVQAGILILVVSGLVLLAGLYLLPHLYLQHQYRQKAGHEKTRVLNSDLNRMKDDARKLNEVVVNSNNRLNALILESQEINNHISQLLQAPLGQASVRDSIELLYQDQVNRIEPAIDSVNTVFSENTSRLVEQLSAIRQQEKEVNILSAAGEMHHLHLIYLKGFAVVFLFLSLSGLITGIILCWRGFRGFGKAATEMQEPVYESKAWPSPEP